MGASAARIPRSNLSEASVRRSRAVRVRLVLTALKLADSSSTFLVSEVISEFAPPITPARPTASEESAMVSMGGLSFRSSPSRVVSISPSRAALTIMVRSLQVSKSKA